MTGHCFKPPDFSQIEKDKLKHEEKVKSARSLFDEILKIEQERATNEKDLVEFLNKKHSKASSFFVDPTTEKTTKIHKKKKKKKKLIVQCDIIKQNKFLSQEICQCCTHTSSLEVRRENDDDESDQFEPEDSEYISGAVSSMREELLDTYYEDIEEDIKQWEEGMEKNPGKTYMKILRKLADLFNNFDLELKEEIEEEFSHPSIVHVKIEQLKYYSCEEESADKFRQYLIVNFPSLKDFLDTFDLKDLDQYQEEAKVLSENNSLINLIYGDLLEKHKKRRRKKNKKKKKEKQGTKESSTTTTDPDKMTEMALIYEEYKEIEKKRNLMDEVIDNFNKMIIDDTKRSYCHLSEEWIEKVKKKIAS